MSIVSIELELEHEPELHSGRSPDFAESKSWGQCRRYIAVCVTDVCA